MLHVPPSPKVLMEAMTLTRTEVYRTKFHQILCCGIGWGGQFADRWCQACMLSDNSCLFTELLDIMAERISLRLWSQKKVQQVPKILRLSSTALDFLIFFPQSRQSVILAAKMRADYPCFHTASVYFSLLIHTPTAKDVKEGQTWKAESHRGSRRGTWGQRSRNTPCLRVYLCLQNFTDKWKKKMLISVWTARKCRTSSPSPEHPFKSNLPGGNNGRNVRPLEPLRALLQDRMHRISVKPRWRIELT